MTPAGQHDEHGPEGRRRRCAVCAAPLAAGRFYVVRVDVFADPSPDPIDTSAGPGEAGYVESVEALLTKMAGMTEDELQDQVARRFEYHVCAACQRLVLANPLGLPRRRAAAVN